MSENIKKNILLHVLDSFRMWAGRLKWRFADGVFQ